jgi:sodium pump decarboxylase gamma subunit
MGATTTNPWLVSLINMTIVFLVLIVLWGIMHILYMVDPTKNKVNEAADAGASAAPAVAAAPAASNDDEVIAVIAAAVAAASGSGDSVPALHIRASRAWTLNAHAEAISVRKECF